jgi:HEAT repeat protein
MARAMEVAPEVELLIVALLADEDHLVRVEAARALAASTSPAAREALRQSLLDRSVVVQEAAEQSLQLLAARSSGRPSGGNPPAVSPRVREPEEAQS